MPEYPDITVYIEALQRRILGERLQDARIGHPFLLRTVDPPVSDALGQEVVEIRRLGKRIAIGFAGDLWFVFHLMIAGRFHWRDAQSSAHRKRDLAAFDFSGGVLAFTEAGTKKRASMHVVRGAAALQAQNPGGLEVFEIGPDEFHARLTRENHTLRRALTDPRLFSGIGNAYSDEILHKARLSPITFTDKLDRADIDRLHEAVRDTLAYWVERLRRETGDGFPEKVTAFREGMAVHGRYGQPCPDCGAPVQRIRYATNETNYCPQCQTRGKLLADRVLSRLLKKDWPRTLEELEHLHDPGEKGMT